MRPSAADPPAATRPLKGDAAARALPALEGFDFPTAVVVTEGGRVLAEAGAVDEIFPFASVTKPIVAWSALIAVERGLLSLDDDAAPDLLPGATIRHLLAHAGGIAFDSDAVLAPGGAGGVGRDHRPGAAGDGERPHSRLARALGGG